MNPICHYLRWRYGNVYALKPPLGYDRRVKQPITRILIYRIWRVEDALFQRWGGEMRRKWSESFTKTNTHNTLSTYED